MVDPVGTCRAGDHTMIIDLLRRSERADEIGHTAPVQQVVLGIEVRTRKLSDDLSAIVDGGRSRVQCTGKNTIAKPHISTVFPQDDFIGGGVVVKDVANYFTFVVQVVGEQRSAIASCEWHSGIAQVR